MLKKLIYIFKLSVISSGIAIALSGCNSIFLTSKTEEISQPQKLPIIASTQISGRTIELEVATTPRQLATGLMFRDSLESDRGMLFLFSESQEAKFWMKNTLIPLDMIFLHQGKVVKIIENVPPCEQDPCLGYGSSTILVDGLLELSSGMAAELKIEVGQKLKFHFFASENN